MGRSTYSTPTVLDDIYSTRGSEIGARVCVGSSLTSSSSSSSSLTTVDSCAQPFARAERPRADMTRHTVTHTYYICDELCAATHCRLLHPHPHSMPPSISDESEEFEALTYSRNSYIVNSHGKTAF